MGGTNGERGIIVATAEQTGAAQRLGEHLADGQAMASTQVVKLPSPASAVGALGALAERAITLNCGDSLIDQGDGFCKASDPDRLEVAGCSWIASLFPAIYCRNRHCWSR